MDQLPLFLQDLNAAQLEAVLHSPHIPLQILAGPGSGKTKVLTCRISHMIRTHNIRPSSIWALTFSNKAANEMRHRLRTLGVDGVRLGTFHSTCATLLRSHGRLVGLEPNFTICDSDESKKILTSVLKSYRDTLTELGFEPREGSVMTLISRAKSRGDTPTSLYASTSPSQASSQIEKQLRAVYDAYNSALRGNNSLDFDDLLLFGAKLLGQHSVLDVGHLFVDEFQDTNLLQFDLLRYMAPHGAVSIVGDPDQSIYGWRSAEVGNLRAMITVYPTTKQILLEDNYRSTTPILALSSAIIAQDTNRIAKSLRTTLTGCMPIWKSFATEGEEAEFMAREIKHLVGATGGLLKYSDFAILLRVSSLSRAIESALQKEGIPNRVLGGHKFFDRMEIKDILAYLTLISNPIYEPAWSRCLQRLDGVGEKTRTDLLARAKTLKMSPMDLVGKIRDGKVAVKPISLKRTLEPLVDSIRVLRKLALEGATPADLIRRLLVTINYGAALKKSHKDWEARIENINELISFAQSFPDEALAADTVESGDDDGLGVLRTFLERATLSTDSQTSGDQDNSKVTIATCHSAKGLEWGVVMIPAVETGVYPSYRSEDHNEERRLLYVACTRAQGLLYMSHASRRMVNGTTLSRQPSDFIKHVLDRSSTGSHEQLVRAQSPSSFSADDIKSLALVLRRQCTFTIEEAADQYFQQQSTLGPASSSVVNLPIGFTNARDTLQEVGLDQSKTGIYRKAAAAANKTIPTIAPVVIVSAQRQRAPAILSVPIPSHSTPKPTIVAQQLKTSVTTMAPEPTVAPLNAKRRLGMGRTGGGYQNKKFKTQGP